MFRALQREQQPSSRSAMQAGRLLVWWMTWVRMAGLPARLDLRRGAVASAMCPNAMLLADPSRHRGRCRRIHLRAPKVAGSATDVSGPGLAVTQRKVPQIDTTRCADRPATLTANDPQADGQSLTELTPASSRSRRPSDAHRRITGIVGTRGSPRPIGGGTQRKAP